MAVEFKDRTEKNNFYQYLYDRGISIVRRRYPETTRIWEYRDIVGQAIIGIDNTLRRRKFDSLKHIECYFYLGLRSSAATFRRTYKKHLSLNATLSFDSDSTFEEFIAYQITEEPDVEIIRKVRSALSRLTEIEKESVQAIIIDGKSIEEFALQKRNNAKFVKRIFQQAKTKLARYLICE
jgi:DNA-directed RNA polymerase specialized sigma24 family protein